MHIDRPCQGEKIDCATTVRDGRDLLYKPIQAEMSTSAAAAVASANKTLRVNSALEGNAADYTPFAQDFLRKHPSATLAAAIHALNCHTADMFLLFLSILAEKYGHSVDDLVATIKTDERWTEAQVHPLVKSLNYFEEADVTCASTAASAIPGKTQADITTEQLHNEVVAPKKSRVTAKPKAGAKAAEEAPAVAAPTKKATAKKKTTVSEVSTIAEAAGVEISLIAEAAAQAAHDAEEAAAAKPKKASKAKTAAATTEDVVEEAAPAEVKPKKASTKAKVAATPTADAEVDAAAEAIASLTVSEVAAAKPKKTVARKPTAAKAV